MAKIYEMPQSAVYRSPRIIVFPKASNPHENGQVDPGTEPGGEDSGGDIILAKPSYNVWED